MQTIRYYSDIGVLPPSLVTEGGYRLYSEADFARLELVRTLRGLGFDLQTIAPSDALKPQIEVLEVQMCSLERQRSVLKSWPYQLPPQARAMQWLIEGLRWSVTPPGRTGC